MILFVLFLFLAVYNAGCMTTLQIQHYGIYPSVGREHFADYMRANNKAATIPTIIPAISLLIVSVLLIVHRPVFVHMYEAAVGLSLNLIAFGSTILWQRRIQGEMAVTGYDGEKIRTLILTNWIRTAAYLLLAFQVIIVLMRVLTTSASAGHRVVG